MKPSEGPGPIRTLPPELPEPPPTAGGQPAKPPDRRWVPLAALGVVIAVLTAVGIFETAPPEAAEQAAPTVDTVPSLAGDAAVTTTTVADEPSLAELVPGLDHSPVVLYRPDDDRTAMASWYLRAPQPRTSVTWGANSTTATLDASRSMVMAITNEGESTLWVGSAPLVVPAFIDIRGAAWHPTDGARIAFVGRAPGSDAHHLYTALGRPTGGITNLVDLGAVPDRTELLGWGEWGFALSRLVEPSLRLWDVSDPDDPDDFVTRELLHIAIFLDADGRPRISMPALPHAVGPNGEVVIQPRIAAYEAAIAAGHSAEELGFVGEVALAGEREQGVTTAAVVGPELNPTNALFFIDEAAMASGSVEFMFSPDGATVVMLAQRDGQMVVSASRLDSNSIRQSYVPADRAIGFSNDGTYLITQNEQTGHILLVNWDRGSSVRIPFTLGPVLVFDV